MRSRGWCFTINNYTDEDIAYVTDIELLGYRYLIIGYEVGEQGTPHLQGFVYFTNPRFFKSVQKIFYPNHIESQKASNIDDAIEYCIDDTDGDYYEVGERPHQGICEKEKIEAVMKDPFSNFHLYNMYRKSYNAYKMTQVKEHERKLYIINESETYSRAEASREAGLTVCIYPSDYVSEDVFITHNPHDVEIRPWIKGFPPRTRVGYEYVVFDPTVVYITYKTDSERRILNKIFCDDIDYEQNDD